MKRRPSHSLLLLSIQSVEGSPDALGLGSPNSGSIVRLDGSVLRRALPKTGRDELILLDVQTVLHESSVGSYRGNEWWGGSQIDGSTRKDEIETRRTLNGESKLRSDEGKDGSLDGSDKRKSSTGSLGSRVADCEEFEGKRRRVSRRARERKSKERRTLDVERVGNVWVTDGSRVSDHGSDGLRSSEESKCLIELKAKEEGRAGESEPDASSRSNEQIETYKMRSQIELSSNPNFGSLLPEPSSSELVLVSVVVRLRETEIKRSESGQLLLEGEEDEETDLELAELSESSLLDESLGSEEIRVEPSRLVGSENETSLLCESDEDLGLLERWRDGLFDDDWRRKVKPSRD